MNTTISVDLLEDLISMYESRLEAYRGRRISKAVVADMEKTIAAAKACLPRLTQNNL